MQDYTLIVPMINTSQKYKNSVPIEFRFNSETGQMNCIESINNIDTSKFTKIIFVILKEHNDKYNISEKIDMSIKMSNFSNIRYTISILFTPTTSQAQTVRDTIVKYGLTGNIFIKDTDNMCMLPNIIRGNSVLAYHLEDLPIVDPQHKSYISIDDQNFVTNIIEKRVISDIFNCGGYSFENASDFVETYDLLTAYEYETNKHIYISHIIYWLILNKNLKFRPIFAEGYNDFDLN